MPGDNDVLCFATVGNSIDESHFCSPSNLIWKPQRLDYDPSDEKFPWLPAATREVWDPESRKKLKEHHLFVQASNETNIFYAGTAHLGNYGSCLDKGDVAANFTLSEKLPREVMMILKKLEIRRLRDSPTNLLISNLLIS